MLLPTPTCEMNVMLCYIKWNPSYEKEAMSDHDLQKGIPIYEKESISAHDLEKVSPVIKKRLCLPVN